MAQIDWGRVKELGLPRVGQISFIVADMAAALPAYASIYGISTWYETHFTQNAVRYGERAYEAGWAFATGYSGKVQVELIDLRGDENNIFGEFLRESGPGLQHLGFYLRDLDEKLARAKSLGISVPQSATLRTKAGIEARVAFLDARSWCGTMLELIEPRRSRFYLPPTKLLMEVGVLLGDGQKIRV